MKRKGIIRNQNGFTLIELMVVAVILAIITAIAVPIYNGYKAEAVAQEGIQVAGQWGQLYCGRIAKARELGTSTTLTAPAAPAASTNFTYAVSGGTLTASGATGTAVAGMSFTLAVAEDGTTGNCTKTLSDIN